MTNISIGTMKELSYQPSACWTNREWWKCVYRWPVEGSISQVMFCSGWEMSGHTQKPTHTRRVRATCTSQACSNGQGAAEEGTTVVEFCPSQGQRGSLSQGADRQACWTGGPGGHRIKQQVSVCVYTGSWTHANIPSRAGGGKLGGGGRRRRRRRSRRVRPGYFRTSCYCKVLGSNWTHWHNQIN